MPSRYPVHPDLSQAQLDALGQAHLRGDIVACPLCESRLQAQLGGYLGRVSVPVLFLCPMHGLLGSSDPPDLRTPWPRAEVRQMLGEYLRRGEARCSEDQAKVHVIYRPGQGETYVHMACPACGRVREGTLPSEELP